MVGQCRDSQRSILYVCWSNAHIVLHWLSKQYIFYPGNGPWFPGITNGTHYILSTSWTCILGFNSTNVCTFRYKHWPWYSLGSPLPERNTFLLVRDDKRMKVFEKSYGSIIVNGVHREVLRPRTLWACGLGTSQGTMIPTRLFHTLSHLVGCQIRGLKHTNIHYFSFLFISPPLNKYSPCAYFLYWAYAISFSPRDSLSEALLPYLASHKAIIWYTQGLHLAYSHYICLHGFR